MNLLVVMFQVKINVDILPWQLGLYCYHRNKESQWIINVLECNQNTDLFSRSFHMNWSYSCDRRNTTF